MRISESLLSIGTLVSGMLLGLFTLTFFVPSESVNFEKAGLPKGADVTYATIAGVPIHCKGGGDVDQCIDGEVAPLV